MLNNDKSLIALCIEAANKALGSKLNVIPANDSLSEIFIEYAFNRYSFKTLIKKNITNKIEVHNLISKLNRNNTIIFSSHISQTLHNYMLENNLNYIDLAGNMLIERDNFLINISGKKIINNVSLKDKNTLVFYSSSLRLIFHLLLNKEFCKNNYRYINNVTKVSLGTIGKTIKKLQSYEILSKEKELIQPKELLELWVVNYTRHMRSKLIVGKYSFTKKFDSSEIITNLDDLSQTFIGNEVSAKILDNYFQSKKLSIYTKDNVLDIIKSLYLKPDPNGDVEILEMFWNSDEITKSQFKNESLFRDKLVPLVLIYTDLINSNNSRAITEAIRLRDKYNVL